jgi:hypothetical protein
MFPWMTGLPGTQRSTPCDEHARAGGEAPTPPPRTRR